MTQGAGESCHSPLSSQSSNRTCSEWTGQWLTQCSFNRWWPRTRWFGWFGIPGSRDSKETGKYWSSRWVSRNPKQIWNNYNRYPQKLRLPVVTNTNHTKHFKWPKYTRICGSDRSSFPFNPDLPNGISKLKVREVPKFVALRGRQQRQQRYIQHTCRKTAGFCLCHSLRSM